MTLQLQMAGKGIERDLAIDVLAGGGKLKAALDRIRAPESTSNVQELSRAYAELHRALRRNGVKPSRTARECAELRVKRHLFQQIDREEAYPFGFALQVRLDEMRLVALRDAFFACDYRVPSTRWSDGDVRLSLSVGRVEIESKIVTAWSKNGKWRGKAVRHFIGIRHDWISSVRCRGLAVVESKLVLYLGPAHEAPDDVDLWEATWVVQGRGLSLRPEFGYLARRRGGDAVLRKGRRAALNAVRSGS